jgi:hypothetical protein
MAVNYKLKPKKACITCLRETRKQRDMAIAILQSAIETEEGNWDGPHDPDDDTTEPAWMESARKFIEEIKI